MNKYFIIPACVIIAFISFLRCRKQGDKCISHTTAVVREVAGPNTAMVNQEIDLTVHYYLGNGCGRFEGLEATSNSNTTLISLKAKYEGCICTEVLLSGQVNYKFKASQPGVYYLKFLQPNQAFFTDTITVN
jgi:hypothetical protein